MKINSYVMLLSVMISIQTFSAQHVQHLSSQSLMMCWSTQRDTRIFVEQSKTMYDLYITNPMGYDYMPQIQGPVTPASLSFQKMQYADLKDIGNHFKVFWNLSECVVDKKKFIMNCNGEAQTSASEIKAVTLNTTEVVEITNGVEFKIIRFRLGLAKNGNTYFVSLEYPLEKCQNYNNEITQSFF